MSLAFLHPSLGGLFGFTKGRGDRLGLLQALLLLAILVALPQLAIGAASLGNSGSSINLYGTAFGSIVRAYALAALIPGVALLAQRFRDMDMSGWWVVGLAVPLLNVALLLLLVFRPGTAGDNRFGPNPAPWRPRPVFNGMLTLRSGRRDALSYIFAMLVALVIGRGLMSAESAIDLWDGPGKGGMILVSGLYIYIAICLIAQRLRDLNWSGWYALLCLVPLLGYLLSLYLALSKGTEGANAYGEDPRTFLPASSRARRGVS